MLSPLTPVALVVLHAQRHLFEEGGGKAPGVAAWHRAVVAAREAGELLVFVQWDGPAGTPGETFSRGWALHPDLRAEAGEVQLRAAGADAFAGSDLEAQLRARAVQAVRLLGRPERLETEETVRQARALGFQVSTVSPL